MFSSDVNHSKLKTNLKLALNRLQLLGKKKTELAQKARKEIADMVADGKNEHAKIRVEHIIRQDYFVEALEIVEIFCDALLSRFGLLQQSKILDSTLAEPVSSLLWVAPHIQADVREMKVISDQLTKKFSKKYTEACRSESMDTVSQKLKHKLSLCPPPKILVEKYLIEISKNYNVPYEPDLQVMEEYEQTHSIDPILFGNKKANDTQPMTPIQEPSISYPFMSSMSSMFDSVPLDFDIINSAPTIPVPAPRQLDPKPPKSNPVPKNTGFSNLADLPNVPTDISTGDIKEKDDVETDLDELLNRFQDLIKNKK